MSEYVLAHGGDAAERERLSLLEEVHGPLTLAMLEAAGVGPGWHCLEAGAGGGGITRWLAERVGPTGSVTAVDLETHWLEPLRSDVVSVHRLDLMADPLPASGYDLATARMLLLHVADPLGVCRKLVAAVRPGGAIALQDADFSAVSLDGASELETEGLAAMARTMVEGGVDVTLGARLRELAEDAEIDVVDVREVPIRGRGGEGAARISAITLERFRARAIDAGVSAASVDGAIAALSDPERDFTGPTQYAVLGRATQPAGGRRA